MQFTCPGTSRTHKSREAVPRSLDLVPTRAEAASEVLRQAEARQREMGSKDVWWRNLHQQKQRCETGCSSKCVWWLVSGISKKSLVYCKVVITVCVPVVKSIF